MAGFTLIEVLVALALVAMLVAPIMALTATTVHGTRSIERHLAQLEIAQAIMTALPDRDQLLTGNLSGEIAGYPWRVDASPFAAQPFIKGKPKPTIWFPQAIAITIGSPAGGLLQLNTVRLHRRAGG